MEISPLSGGISPHKILRKVDFPAPFFPANPMRSRLFTKKEISSYKGTPLKLTVRLLTDITAFLNKGANIEIYRALNAKSLSE